MFAIAVMLGQLLEILLNFLRKECDSNGQLINVLLKNAFKTVLWFKTIEHDVENLAELF